MVKKIYLVFLLVFILGLVSSLDSLGTFVKDDCVEISQTCSSCTYLNTSVTYPNSTIAINNTPMTSQGAGLWKYSFCNTSTMGRYDVTGSGDLGGTATSFDAVYFEITYDGNVLDVPKSILYLGLITILIFLFVLIVSNIDKLPSSDLYNDEKILVGINNLKYLRPILWGVSWGLLLGIMFITANISIAYLPTAMFGEFFFMIYSIMFWITTPMFFIWFIYIFAKIWRDVEVKKMMDRGVEFKGEGL